MKLARQAYRLFLNKRQGDNQDKKVYPNVSFKLAVFSTDSKAVTVMLWPGSMNRNDCGYMPSGKI